MREVIVTFFIGLLAFMILATVIITIGFLLIKYTTITQITDSEVNSIYLDVKESYEQVKELIKQEVAAERGY